MSNDIMPDAMETETANSSVPEPTMDMERLCGSVSTLTSKLSHEYDVMTSKLINQAFMKHMQILETYYTRINQITLHVEQGKANLDKFTEIFSKMEEIRNQVRNNYTLANTIAEQNNRLIAFFMDVCNYPPTTGKRGDTSFTVIKKDLDNVIRKLDKAGYLPETPYVSATNSVSDSNTRLDWSKYNLKNPLETYNEYINTNNEELLTLGFSKYDLERKNGYCYLVNTKGNLPLYYGIKKQDYVALFPSALIRIPSNAVYYSNVFRLNYYNAEPTNAKIHLERMAVLKYNPESKSYDIRSEGQADML